MSASSIGSYIDCPFKYFVDRGLRPREEKDFSSDPRSIGDAYHECLMRIARIVISDRDLLAQAADIARCGAGVILDWGFWSKDEREKTGAFFADRQLPVQWHYLDVSAERWEENIQKRNTAPGPSDYLVDEGLKQKCLAAFQPPDSAEREGWHVVGS